MQCLYALCLFYAIINPRYSVVFGRLVTYRVVRRHYLTLRSATDAPLEGRNWRKTTIIIIIIII
jgi:hypothetical protein